MSAESNLPAVKVNPQQDFFLAHRETVESIAVAIILALLFRAFIAEAFVIPTGSMAPTLMGRHVDVRCDECGYAYQAGASAERDGEDRVTNIVTRDARCPNCGYRKELDLAAWSNERSFSGDRIIVSKFAYELTAPKRWDVIVFKFPQRSQQNYIKRLIGLPNETIRIAGGNIYVRKQEETKFQIARKPDDRLLTLLQIVHDSDFPAPTLKKVGWPLRWQEHAGVWKSDEEGKQYTLTKAEGESWLRYHHYDPREMDWEALLESKSPDIPNNWPGRLVSDFYAYNCAGYEPSWNHSPQFGQHWVDDLALECEVEIGNADGELLLDLVRGGSHYRCRITPATGAAELSVIDFAGKPVSLGENGAKVETVSGTTSMRAPGKYRLRFSNVDHELRLWVNESPIAFDGSTAYDSPEFILPEFSEEDNADFAPVGIGGKNMELTVRHLRVLRDKYYVAGANSEYDSGFERSASQILWTPNRDIAELLKSRRGMEYKLGDDQFMPLGDNSPASSDARAWNAPYVEKKLMIGKALIVFWPHSWNQPPYWPNFQRMRPIR